MALVDIINNNSFQDLGAKTRTAGEMGKDEFLHLLVTQLKNQDPLDPVKNEQFVAQLAQFNSLEQMINLNKSFTSMLDLQKLSFSSSFIGKSVSYFGADGSEKKGSVLEVQIAGGEAMLVVGDSAHPEAGGELVSPGDVVAIGQ